MPRSKESDELIFFVNGRKVIEKNADPEVNLLFYLRKVLRLTGTKYGCGGGDCGACTVMISRYDPISKKISHFSVTACLVPICSLHGAAVTTVERIGSTKSRIHPVQERIAKGHGTRCGFCTPGMVMSMYTLLRNHPEPSTEQLMETLGEFILLPKEQGREMMLGQRKKEAGGQNQRDRDNRIVFFCGLVCTKLFEKEEFQPLDPTQELIFPPELMRMAEDAQKKVLAFHGERTTWIAPGTLKDLLELKVKHPSAPLVMGNTFLRLDAQFGDVSYPIILSPSRILELFAVTNTKEGLTLGAGISLAQMKDILADVVSTLPKERTQTYCALLKHLRTLAGQQIRNMASLGGHIISRLPTSDLNPVLGVGNCILNAASTEGTQQIPLNDHFLAGATDASLKPEQVLVSVFIPVTKKWEFVSAFRQAPRQQNALAIVNAGMKVLFKEDTNTIVDLSILYGGIGTTTVSVNKACQELVGMCWDEGMLDEACRLVRDEISLPASAPRGMVEYQKTLAISFLFKFYLDVLQQLKMKEPHEYPDISRKLLDVLEDFPLTMPQGMQFFEDVDPTQPLQDPVGRPIMHQSGIKHSTGEAVFCDGMPVLAEEVFLAVVTSTSSLDATEALASPGVVDVIMAQDVPGDNGREEETLYAQDEVICVGQIICTVAARSYVHAKQAAKKVKIVYQDIEPVIVTVQDALRHRSFIGPEKKLEQGNVQAAFQFVDQILEEEVHFGGQEHFYMETQSIRVVPRAEDKEMDIYVSSQDAAFTQEMVARTLGIPKNRINCHVKRVDGVFGGKSSKPGLLAAVAAQKTGCPIRFVLERGDDMLITGGRHPLLGRYKIGFMNNGKIEAADIEFYISGGCTPDDSELVIEYALLKLENAYKIPNLHVRGRVCKTNLPSNTAFRGFGFPQGAFVTETWVSAVAAKCHLPPEKAAALVHTYTDGSVLVAHGGVELGQGINTKMIQVASRELKIPMSYIHLDEMNTMIVPNTIATAASTGADVNGRAVQLLMKRLEPIISQNPDGPWEAWVNEAFTQSISLSATGCFRGYKADMDWEKGEGDIFPYFVFGAACSEVEIDCLTGAHKNIRTDLVMDASFSTNPAVDIGQIEGAFVQGLGLYTLEELKYSPEGVLYTRGPNQYKIPSVTDIPEELHVSLLTPTQNPKAIYSSKGLGEAGMFLGSSVFFAIADAVASALKERGLSPIWAMNRPATPELIRMACVDRFTDQVPQMDSKCCKPWSIPVA